MKKTLLTLPALTLLFAAISPAQYLPPARGGNKVDLDLFGGGSAFRSQRERPFQDQANGGVLGFRVTENLWQKWSLEQAFTLFGTANTRIYDPATNGYYGFGTRMRQFQFNPVYHFTPRTAKTRPYITGGVGFDWFGVTDDARAQIGTGISTPFRTAWTPESDFRFAGNVGAGFKHLFTDRLGMRFDVRTFLTESPRLGMPAVGGVLNGIGGAAFTRDSALSHTQATGAITFGFGAIHIAPPGDYMVGQIQASRLSACPDERITFKLPVYNTFDGVGLKRRWTIDGKDAGVDGDTLVYTAGNTPGYVLIKGTVAPDASQTLGDTKRYLTKNPLPAVERAFQVRVKEYKPPVVTSEISDDNINWNESTSYITRVAVSECSGALKNALLANGFTVSGPDEMSVKTGRLMVDDEAGPGTILLNPDGSVKPFVGPTAPGGPGSVTPGTGVGRNSDQNGYGSYEQAIKDGKVPMPGSAGPAGAAPGDMQSGPGAPRTGNMAGVPGPIATTSSTTAGPGGLQGVPGLKPGVSPEVITVEQPKTLTPNPSVMNLPEGGAPQQVSVTSTVTDSKGNSASSAAKTITVNAPPKPEVKPDVKPVQLDDILFARGRTRVNNCGKRILDQAFERAAASNDYDVLLVGHIDESEMPKARKGRRAPKNPELDRKRALNAAAILTAAVPPCNRLEVTRVKIAVQGSTQNSPMKGELCASSTKERKADRIGARDSKAQFRRVEVWLVPKTGMGTMPEGLGEVVDAPADEVKKLGCPK
jgi:outer membrane protein OmpA-like peptidoglycan-associated protein